MCASFEFAHVKGGESGKEIIGAWQSPDQWLGPWGILLCISHVWVSSAKIGNTFYAGVLVFQLLFQCLYFGILEHILHLLLF